MRSSVLMGAACTSTGANAPSPKLHRAATTARVACVLAVAISSLLATKLDWRSLRPPVDRRRITVNPPDTLERMRENIRPIPDNFGSRSGEMGLSDTPPPR